MPQNITSIDFPFRIAKVPEIFALHRSTSLRSLNPAIRSSSDEPPLFLLQPTSKAKVGISESRIGKHVRVYTTPLTTFCTNFNFKSFKETSD